MVQKGFSQVILLGIVAVLILVGTGGFLIYQKQQTAPSTEEPFSQSESSLPQIEPSQQTITTQSVEYKFPPSIPSYPDTLKDGPWNRDLKTAESSDGTTFSGEKVFEERAGVPSATFDSKGRLLAVFQWFPFDEKNKSHFDQVAVKISDDNGATWSKPQPIKLANYPDGYMRPFDPTLVALSDGKIRMYFTSNVQGQVAIYSAISDDGINYIFEPDMRFGAEGEMVVDSAVAKLGSTWHIISPNNAKGVKSAAYHGISSDGLVFTRKSNLVFQKDVTWIGNLLEFGSGLRFYGSGQKIWWTSTANGDSWAEPVNTNIVGGDPTVIKRLENKYLMFFVGGPKATLPMQQPPQQFQQPQQQPQQGISVKATGSKYKTVITKPTTGWFKTGQDADIMLSGIDFNNTGGPLLFNHPGEIASDGTRLLLADRNNNRVLIWNKLPTGNTPPDLVLGQPDFIQNNPGTGLNQFNWPSSVAVASGKVVVADTENDRILIWNSFPTQNAQPADLVLDLPTIARGLASGNNFEWPWGVWTDGIKLAVAATQGSRVLLWNTFPTRNNQLPDVALSAQGKFGTPRGITSNGQYLIVGDHNAKVPIGPSGNIDGSATFVWKTWPLSNDQPYDFYLEGMRAGTFLPNNGLILLSTTHYPVSIWNAPPTSANDVPDLILGNTAGLGAPGYYFVAGDSSDIVFAGGRLYFSLANGNKIVAYNAVPSDPLAVPDFAIGAPDAHTNTLETNFMLGNPVVATDGKSLFVSSDFERKLYVWKSLPDESSADPDFVYDLFGARGEINFSPWDNALWGNTLVLAGRKTVYIWTRLPLNGEMPDRIITGKIGSVTLNNIIGVALDDKYFYLSDDSNKIYVWEGVPTSGAEPRFTLIVQGPGRLDSDGKYLVGVVNNNTSPGQHTVGVWNVATLSGSSLPSILPTDSQDVTRRFNGIGSVVTKAGYLFIADTGFGRVLVWRDINDALAGKQADVVLGAADLRDTSEEIGQNKLFWPASLAFDGSFLWVGEFKFSNRLLRFSIK